MLKLADRPECSDGALCGGRFGVWRCAGSLLLGAILLAVTGCGQQEQQPVVEPPVNEITARQPVPLPAPAAAKAPTDGKPLAEFWEVIYMQGAKAGYMHTRTEQIVEQGRTLRQTEAVMQIRAQRFGELTVPRMRFSSVETPDGGLVRFSSHMELGPQPMVASGYVEQGQLHKQAETGEPTTIAWQADWGGYFAVPQSLREQPMQPGQTRTIQHLEPPPFNSLGKTVLEAIDYETTALLSGSRRLLKIKSTEFLGAATLESMLWVDEQGEVLKQEAQSMTWYRVDRETATAEAEAVDLGERLAVRLNHRLNNPHQTQRIVYRAQLRSKNPAEIFDRGVSQAVRAVDEQTAEIEVRAVRPGQPSQSGSKSEPPGAAELAPNRWIQSDDPQVKALATSVAQNERDPWKLACALEQLVHVTVDNKGFSQAFATAAEVVRSREGDCTEHAMLLTALCRARNLPARVAMGLVYYQMPSGGAMAYHMWTEVWIGDRWVPLDGTLGRCGIGAAHLKLSDSNLAGDEALASYLEVSQVLGQLELEIVEVQ